MFDQTIPSVALAKILKKHNSNLPIALGGYALEGRAGVTITKSFPWIDLVVLGDGEEVIIDLARAALAGLPLDANCRNLAQNQYIKLKKIDGEFSVSNSSVIEIENLPIKKIMRAPNIDLNWSPTPNYDDWFEDLNALRINDKIAIHTRVLPVESSRGCWWGQHKHCVFCGIDEGALNYRYKSARRTLDMLEEIRGCHGDHVFRFADYIMPKDYYTDLLPLLSGHNAKFRLEAEIKANHPPERVKLLSEAGFIEVQPGIESFSTRVLKSMDKGVRAIDNVSLLKAGYINRIIINYNFLYGLPDDNYQDYLKMAESIPRLYHLTPPIARTETVITRFAPLQIHPERFGIMSEARHHRCYDVLFSRALRNQTGFSLDDYAYYFDRNFSYAPDLETIYSEIIYQMDYWKAQHRNRFVELSYLETDDGLEIEDSRFGAPVSYNITGPAALVYLACDSAPVNINRIVSRISSDLAVSAMQVSECIDELNERRIIFKEGDLVFGLAVPRSVCDAHRDTQWPRSWMSLYVS
ncbi:hypothetical protein CS8_096630 [Cupriavidus sp. 8B]